MNNYQEIIKQLIIGRNSEEKFYRIVGLIFIIVFILDIFIPNIIFFYIQVVLFIVLIYRLYCKKNNKSKCKTFVRINKYFDLQKRKFNDRNTHIYKKCPKCKGIVRLPLKKGKHTVKCPTCGNRFTVRCMRDEKIKVEVIHKK